jgi:hypothetical protein
MKTQNMMVFTFEFTNDSFLRRTRADSPALANATS